MVNFTIKLWADIMSWLFEIPKTNLFAFAIQSSLQHVYFEIKNNSVTPVIFQKSQNGFFKLLKFGI